MEEQSYAKHNKLVPLYHGLLFVLLVVAFFGSLWNVYRAVNNNVGRLSAGLITVLAFAAIIQFFFARTFPLKAQDRAIRAEENLRHFAMTGKLLDKRLTVKQIVGLRFASDGEFVALAQKAADESMSPDAIKKSVKSWKADYDRL